MVYIANNNLIFRMNHNRMGEDKGGSLVSKKYKKRPALMQVFFYTSHPNILANVAMIKHNPNPLRWKQKS